MKLETVKSLMAIAVIMAFATAFVAGCSQCFVKPATVLAVIQK